MKKHTRKALGILCALVMGVSCLAGCSSSSSTPAASGTDDGSSKAATDPASVSADLRMAWWGGDERHQATLGALDEFSKSYPNINVVAEYQGYDGYHDKMFTQLVGKTAPDLFQYDPQSLPEAVQGGKILPLDEYVENGLLDLSNVSDSALASTTIGGKLYGVPMSTQTICVIYNKTLFDEAGVAYPEDDWTWEDYEATIRELAEKLPEGVYPSTDLRVHDICTLAMVHQDGGRYINEDGTVGFADTMAEPLERFQAYMEEGLVPPVETSTAKTNDQLFMEGKAAIHATFNAMATSLQAGSTDQDEYALTSIPSANTGEHLGMWVKGEVAFCIAADSPNKEAAVILLNEFINNPDMNAILGLCRGIPPSSAVQTQLSEELSGIDADVFKVQEMAAASKDEPEVLATPGYVQVLEVVRQETDEYRYGRKDAETTVNDMVERAQKEINNAQD